MPERYIVVIGSLMSGLGKGVTSSAISKILSFYDLKVLPLKFDGYLNYDCGTMNPMKHGEVFVLDDKSEVDMDFGTYERFLNTDLNGSFSMTGGKLFSEIISKERRGDFLGSDVQIIPHLTDMIVNKVSETHKANSLDALLIEVGGTVGDIENSYFIEAMRELALKKKVIFVVVTYVPELGVVGEQKTKPAQLSMRHLMQMGIQPNFIVTRSEMELEPKARDKIALFANLNPENIIDCHDLANVYEIPAHFMKSGFDKKILAELGVEMPKLSAAKFDSWNSHVRLMTDDSIKRVKISVVGKYVDLHDSYVSVREALIHGAAANGARADVEWVDSEELEKLSDAQIEERFKSTDGILVPGGFGKRGIEGMVRAIRHARERKIPYLGICLGMQLMAVEFARNVAGLSDANSTEFNKDTTNKVIDIMESQKGVESKGGTMRLGSWPAMLANDTATRLAYGRENVQERHRHRYEFNNNYRDVLAGKGLVISGTTPDGKLVEFIEWKDSFGIATQSHPELKSRPETPAPLFVAFLKSAVAKKG